MDDIIVCNALENASDYDLDNFKEIMNSWINQDGLVEYPRTDKERLEKTCLWCVYSRLFSINGLTWGQASGKDDSDSKTVKTNHVPNSSSNILLNLINDLGQVWNY